MLEWRLWGDLEIDIMQRELMMGNGVLFGNKNAAKEV